MSVLEITVDEYHADPSDVPSLSASIAHILCTSSCAHAYAAHPKLNLDLEREEAAHFDLGKAVHSLLLEGVDNVTILQYTDWRKKEAREAREEARAAGRVPLLADQAMNVMRMVKSVRKSMASFDADPPLLERGKPERTLMWEEEGGVVCRALVDWLHDDHQAIDDLKTTSRSAAPEAWSRSMFSFGGDVQAAFYLRGLRAVSGSEAVFRFVVAETQPPYALSVFTPGPDVLAVADAKVEFAIRKWRHCLETGEWPSYPRQVCTVELPAWEEPRWAEREAREDEA